MRAALICFSLTLTVFAISACGQSTSPQTNDRPAARQVAVTFDDLPGVAVPQSVRCQPKGLTDLNRRLVDSAKRNAVPAFGLVTQGNACRESAASLAAILNIWLDAGFDLGNHTYSHFDLNSKPLAEYESDIILGEGVVKKVLADRGMRLRYFRYPMLHSGKTADTKKAVQSFLASRGYTNAPVTIDNQEWVFANAYARALDQGDAAKAKRISDAYLTYMNDVFDYYEKWSVEVTGREIRQVLLLHVNSLNADTFDQLAAIMRRRGYSFISLDEALKDPAYQLPDDYVGTNGISWLHRWALTKGMKVKDEPREPAWLTAQ